MGPLSTIHLRARATGVAGVLVALALLTACASSRAFDGDEAPQAVRLHVANNNFNDVTIHARRGALRILLGRVVGKTEADYTFDWNLSMPLAIELDFVAGGTCVTPPMDVDPGDILQLEIPADGLRASECAPIRRE